MTKENWLSIGRSFLTLLGTFLIGHSAWGHTIDAGIWETAGGIVLAGVGVILGIKDKTTTPEKWSSFIRSAIIGLGGIGVAWGWILNNTYQSISAFVVSVLPVILSQTSKVTAKQIVTGKATANPDTGKVLKIQPPGQ